MDRLINTYGREYAPACFTDDLTTLLAIHRVPVQHGIGRITLAERGLVARWLVLPTMIRGAGRWCHAVISGLPNYRAYQT